MLHDLGSVRVVVSRAVRMILSIMPGLTVLNAVLVLVQGLLPLAALYVIKLIVDTVTAVTAPACIAESADGKRLYIADYDGAVTILKVASTTESLLAKMMSADVIDIPMLELEGAGVR